MVFCENVNNCSNYVDPKTVVEQRSALAVSSLNFSAAQLKVNEFSRTICGFNKKGAELVYAQSNHHKKRLTVILDTDSAVAVCKRSETNEWIVPFDIAGIDNDHLSGKKQHKKCARFIVHPDTVAIASEDMSLRVKIEETAKELVSHFIDDQWELVVPQKMGTDVIEFNRLKDRFMKAQCHIYRNADDQDRITISYVFKNSSEGQSLSVNSKNLSLKVGTLQSYKSSNDNDNVCSSDECMFGQTISLQHKKNGESNLILQVTFTWKVNQKLFSTEVKDYSMLLNSCGLFIELRCLCFNAKTCIEELCERVSTLLFGLDGSTHLMSDEKIIIVYFGGIDISEETLELFLDCCSNRFVSNVDFLGAVLMICLAL
uniref:ISP1_C domain-containing protein n=1 Tax=Syphacia muris TaxID=451379 RepID=A0A158R4F0_9BILA